MEDWLRLYYLKGISKSRKLALVRAFESPDALFSASSNDVSAALEQCFDDQGDHRPDPRQVSALTGLLSSARSAAISRVVEQDMAALAELDAGFIAFTDASYPPLLSEIADPPLGLFYRGNGDMLLDQQIAIVGSRLATRTGCATARQFARELSEAGITITSGLALGIDREAHQGALDVEGRTIAVIATGIDGVYPSRNRSTYSQLYERGLVISEFPPGTPPRREHFPVRNRIISGLSSGTLVIEANLRSGSLITARLAAEQGRDVFAIPGGIQGSANRGCHRLIKQGAKLVESVKDILEELDLSLSQVEQQAPEKAVVTDPELAPVFVLLDYSPCGVDQLIDHSGLTAKQVSSILVRLEMQGLVWESDGGYQLAPQFKPL